MACEVDSPWSQVDVHEVVDDPTLNVPFVLEDNSFLTGVEDLEEAEIALTIFVEGLVLKE